MVIGIFPLHGVTEATRRHEGAKAVIDVLSAKITEFTYQGIT